MLKMNLCFCFALVLMSVPQGFSQIHKGYANIFDIIRNLPYFLHARQVPEIYMRVYQLITYYGYNAEGHTVQTEDGYLCNLYRVQRKTGISKNYPVLLIHGFYSSSGIWLVNQNNSLGFLLAEEGYDVWLMNFRGTSYCNRQLDRNAEDPKFWNFSWDEYGNLDLATTIDYILKITKKPKLYSIAHSEGTTSVLALLSNRTEYNEKIKLLILMSPITDLRDVKNPLIKFFLTLSPLLKLLRLIRVNYFPNLPDPGVDPCKFQPTLCQFFTILIEGGISPHFDFSKSSSFYSILPDYTSIQNFLHYFQVYTSGKFAAYDYGSSKKNKKHYKTAKPPLYDLSKITTPTALIWGSLDKFSPAKVSAKLKKKLSNVVAVEEVPFNHLDFFLAVDLYQYLYVPVQKLLKKW